MPDTVVLHASNTRPGAQSVFLQGHAVVASFPFGDGLRCAGGNLKPLHTTHASGGVVRARRLAAADAPSARWIGRDALRELVSPAVARRLAARRRRASK